MNIDELKKYLPKVTFRRNHIIKLYSILRVSPDNIDGRLNTQKLIRF
jgi:hypothetical protein